jgi:hypothetical protein
MSNDMNDRAINEPLQDWFNAQREATPDEMFYKEASGSQIMFVRDDLRYLVASGLYYEEAKDICRVISHHTSKSVKLPVYQLSRPDLGLRLILRDNFYDWKLSVISETPIVADFSGLFRTTPPIAREYTGCELASCYFEGFPEELVFGYYEPSDKRRWSAAIGGRNALWTTVFLMMRALGAVKPRVWHTRESRKAQMAEESARNKRARELRGEKP